MIVLIPKITVRTGKMQSALKEANLFVQIVSSMDEIQKRDGWGVAIDTVAKKFPGKEISISALSKLRKSLNEAYAEMVSLLDEAEKILKSQKKY